jgi:hypothetical protein
MFRFVPSDPLDSLDVAGSASVAGIRLAAIYRTHQRDAVKSDTLVARLCAQYTDASELRFVRGA